MLKKITVILLIVCLVLGVLAGCNRREVDKQTHDTFLEVLPNAKNFSKVNTSGYNIPSTVREVYYDTEGAGFVIKVVTCGYRDGLTIIVGIDNNGVITGAKCIESNESWKIEQTLGYEFIGKNINTYVDVEAGATSLTVNGYRNAVGDALNTVFILKGGEVSKPDPEKTLNDHLNAALPEANGKFTKLDGHFIDRDGNIYTYADLDVDAIYMADNYAGYVFVIGDKFIPSDANGIWGGATDEEIVAIEIAKALVNSQIDVCNVDITEFKNSSDRDTKRAFKNINFVKVVERKTINDIYIVETVVNGYGADPIVMVITVDEDGIIIDYAVISHSETRGYGGEKLDSDYFDEFFAGKNLTECEEVDITNGATITSKAVKKAFTCSLIAVNAIANN